jgi:U2 small nuclear ribonucleoprotein B''
VLDIVALKTPKMRGQAHITLKDIQTAAQAMRQLDGFEFFERPMVSQKNPLILTTCSNNKQRISYAKSKSNFVAKLDGTFKIPVVNEPAKTAAEKAAGDKGTALQQSVFSGVPPSAAQAAGQGVKRGREEEDESEGDAPMEEDEEDMEMDESDDD